jgi:hypothetical protein
MQRKRFIILKEFLFLWLFLSSTDSFHTSLTFPPPSAFKKLLFPLFSKPMFESGLGVGSLAHW